MVEGGVMTDKMDLNESVLLDAARRPSAALDGECQDLHVARSN